MWFRAAIAAICFVPLLLAQQAAIDPSELHVGSGSYSPPGQVRLRGDARLVEIGAVVHGSDGRAVADLTRADFEIRDEGKKREISAFTVQRAAARTANSRADAEHNSTPAQASAKRSIALLFDDRNSSAGDFQQAQDAALHFLEAGLTPGTHVAILTVGSGQVTAFTSDVAELRAAIRKLVPRLRVADNTECPQLTPYLAYLIANNLDHRALEAKVVEMFRCDPGLQSAPAPPARAAASGGRGAPPPRPSPPAPGAVSIDDPVGLRVISKARILWQEQEILAKGTLDGIRLAVDRLGAQPGDRTLLLTSAGFLAGTLQPEQEALISRALGASIVISCLDTKGLFAAALNEPPPNAAGRAAIFAASLGNAPVEATNDILANLADGTGGRFFRSSNDLTGGFRELTVAPEVSYVLGFAPAADPDGNFHRVKVQLPGRKDLTVQARRGYFAAKETPVAPRAERPIDREVFTTTTTQDVPSNLQVNYESVPGALPLLRAVFAVDVRKLGLIERSGVRRQKLEFLVALLDAQGNFVSGKEGFMEFALKQSTFDRISGTRLDAALQLEAAPGDYRLRVLVWEANRGKFTAATQMVQIR